MSWAPAGLEMVYRSCRVIVVRVKAVAAKAEGTVRVLPRKAPRRN